METLETVYCVNRSCRLPISPNAAFCPTCGMSQVRPQPGAPAPPTITQPPKPQPVAQIAGLLGRCAMCGSCEIEETKVKIGEKCPPAAIGSLIGAFICSVSAPELSPVAGLIAIVVCGLTQRKNETRNRCKACGYLWKP